MRGGERERERERERVRERENFLVNKSTLKQNENIDCDV